jgi:hypothetical protein
MFVFGINLPVAEILFVVLLLFIIALVIIIVQLGRMSNHIKVLDETTLEIRRYESEEEVALKGLEHDPELLTAQRKRSLNTQFLPALQQLEKKAVARLLDGETPTEVRNSFVVKGVNDAFATRAVNNAVFFVNKFQMHLERETKEHVAVLKKAAK